MLIVVIYVREYELLISESINLFISQVRSINLGLCSDIFPQSTVALLQTVEGKVKMDMREAMELLDYVTSQTYPSKLSKDEKRRL